MSRSTSPRTLRSKHAARLFSKYDLQGNGTLSLAQTRAAMSALGLKLTPADTVGLVQKYKAADAGDVRFDYGRFIRDVAATSPPRTRSPTRAAPTYSQAGSLFGGGADIQGSIRHWVSDLREPAAPRAAATYSFPASAETAGQGSPSAAIGPSRRGRSPGAHTANVPTKAQSSDNSGSGNPAWSSLAAHIRPPPPAPTILLSWVVTHWRLSAGAAASRRWRRACSHAQRLERSRCGGRPRRAL